MGYRQHTCGISAMVPRQQTRVLPTHIFENPDPATERVFLVMLTAAERLLRYITFMCKMHSQLQMTCQHGQWYC